MDTRKSEPEKKKDDTVSEAGNIRFSGDVVGRDEGNVGRITVNTSGSSYIGGDVNIGGGTFVGRDDYSLKEVAKIFESINRQIDQNVKVTSDEKESLKADVNDLQREIDKGDGAEPFLIERQLRDIKYLAPDILEVVVTAFANPVLGVATGVRRVMEKAKFETKRS